MIWISTISINPTIIINKGLIAGDVDMISGKPGTPYKLPDIVDVPGYDFAGWGLSADATEAVYKPGDAYKEDSDVTLYAVWNEKVIVPVKKEISVSVNITSTKSGKGKNAVTTYTAKISASAIGTTVKNVAYSLNNGASYTNGTSFSQASKPDSFLIRVTDADGDIYDFSCINGVVNER